MSKLTEQSIDELVETIKDSLYGEDKENKFICEIIIKHHAHGEFDKSIQDLNNWIWLATYYNCLLGKSIQGNGNNINEALIDLYHKLLAEKIIKI